MNLMNIIFNKHTGADLLKPALMGSFDRENAKHIQKYHQTIKGYEPTPLVSLPHMAKHLSIGALYVKDESYRFGLNAFKGLGGSYCLGKYLSTQIKEQTGTITFVTATDGNHGRGIAWAAACLGHKAVVYLPKGSAPERLENIKKEGAEAFITDWNYDDTVRYAQKQAHENGWVLVQDTVLPGYEEIPTYIMQGYLTMAYEAVMQLAGKIPTHIFLQAGVGAMAGSLSAFFRNIYGFVPKIVIVEPDKADCIYQTAKADDQKLHFVTGDLDTVMAGLACGEPCLIGWNLLHYCADAFLSMEDDAAVAGTQLLAHPFGNDLKIISGESGAAGFGALAEILLHHNEIKNQLDLNEHSVVLCFSTEGALKSSSLPLSDAL